jgi:hypothetical protein
MILFLHLQSQQQQFLYHTTLAFSSASHPLPHPVYLKTLMVTLSHMDGSMMIPSILKAVL